MTQEELNVIEKYMTKEEIKELIQEELRGKLRKDFEEMYYQTLFSPKNKYINNVVYALFKDYVLENHAEALETKAKEAIGKMGLDYILGSTWDRKEKPDAINRLDGMKIVNKAFEESIPEIKNRIVEVINNKSDDTFYDEFSMAYNERLFDIIDGFRKSKTN